MSGAGWPAIDWSAPWFEPWRAVGEPVDRAVAQGVPVHRALQAVADAAAAPDGALAQHRAPLRFVPQSELPEGMAYERFIFETGAVPTRDNLHDFFNGLVWLRFPCTKRRMNQLQAQALATQAPGDPRGPVRDALTLLDENGLLLQAPEPLWQALRQRQWQRLGVELRPLWAQARVELLGHALLEKLVSPWKSITAHVYQADLAIHFDDGPDAPLAQDLRPERLATKPFTPLPVLGIPGWWPASEMPVFYDDSTVFRSARRGAVAEMRDTPA
ncbi:MAG: DUF3025 domain-containing protein [Burkholderiaceae bacterium]|nr:DUF3025 domain-containing protein [Burkholderiaceae bacterium]